MTKPEAGTAYIKQHAQELEDEVVSSHIGLYVNDFSLGLGAEGVAAVEELLHQGVAAGVFTDPGGQGWQLFR